jgi:hypothetical protein
MKVLLDTCVWGGAAAELRAVGHDVVWAGDWDAGLDGVVEQSVLVRIQGANL